jgi:hypothetical protein
MKDIERHRKKSDAHELANKKSLVSQTEASLSNQCWMFRVQLAFPESGNLGYFHEMAEYFKDMSWGWMFA